MRSSNFSYSASGLGALRIAAWTSFGIAKGLLLSTGRDLAPCSSLNVVHNNPAAAKAATPPALVATIGLAVMRVAYATCRTCIRELAGLCTGTKRRARRHGPLAIAVRPLARRWRGLRAFPLF